MKQMMSVAEGIFFAISILCLILGDFAIAEKSEFGRELKSRDPVTRELNRSSGWVASLYKTFKWATTHIINLGSNHG